VLCHTKHQTAKYYSVLTMCLTYPHNKYSNKYAI
jgi:hypothetical protein